MCVCVGGPPSWSRPDWMCFLGSTKSSKTPRCHHFFLLRQRRSPPDFLSPNTVCHCFKKLVWLAVATNSLGCVRRFGCVCTAKCSHHWIKPVFWAKWTMWSNASAVRDVPGKDRFSLCLAQTFHAPNMKIRLFPVCPYHLHPAVLASAFWQLTTTTTG